MHSKIHYEIYVDHIIFCTFYKEKSIKPSCFICSLITDIRSFYIFGTSDAFEILWIRDRCEYGDQKTYQECSPKLYSPLPYFRFHFHVYEIRSEFYIDFTFRILMHKIWIMGFGFTINLFKEDFVKNIVFCRMHYCSWTENFFEKCFS